jgi:hypothetical protein
MEKSMRIVLIDEGEHIWAKGIQDWFHRRKRVKRYPISDLVHFPERSPEIFDISHSDKLLQAYDWKEDFVVILRKEYRALVYPLYARFLVINDLASLLLH